MSSIEERVQRLEDRVAIEELIANYCHGVDEREEELFLSIWAEDAKYILSEAFGGKSSGLAAIKGVVHGLWEGFTEFHHHTTNIVIDLDGDAASARSNVDVTGTHNDGRALMMSATYTDKFKRQDGEWKFSERTVDLHFMRPVLDPWSNSPESRFLSA